MFVYLFVLVRVQLGEFEASVAVDGVPQFVAQSAALLVVRQLEEVEAGRRRRQTVQRILLSYCKEASDNAACVQNNRKFKILWK